METLMDSVLWRKRHKPNGPTVPRWGRVMIGLLVAVYLGGSAGAVSAAYLFSTIPLVSIVSGGAVLAVSGFGATTIRMVPDASLSSSPVSTCPGVNRNAFSRVSYAVPGFNWSWSPTTSEIPVSRPSTENVSGLSGYGESSVRGGIGFSVSQSQPAFARCQKICSANWYDSASSFTYSSSTFPLGPSFTAPLNLSPSIIRGSCWLFSSSSLSSASLARALASEIPFAISSLYFSNSIFDSAISVLCSLTTAQVAAPAINAKNPAMIRDTTMAFSQPCSDKPSITLTFFELSAVVAIVAISIGFVVLFIVVIWDLCRRRS